MNDLSREPVFFQSSKCRQPPAPCSIKKILLSCFKFSLSHGQSSGENETAGKGLETGCQDEHQVGCQSSIGKGFLNLQCIPACCATLEIPSTVFTAEQ